MKAFMSSHKRFIISLGLVFGSIFASSVAGYSIYTTHIITSDTSTAGFSLVLPTSEPGAQVELHNKEMLPTELWIADGKNTSPTQTAIGGRLNVLPTPQLEASSPAHIEPLPTMIPTEQPTQAPTIQIVPTLKPVPTASASPSAELTPTPPTATTSAQLAG